MNIFLSMAMKIFVIFAYFLFVAYSEWIVAKLMPECKLKTLLLRKF